MVRHEQPDETADGLRRSRAARFAVLTHGFIGTMHNSPAETIKYGKSCDPRLVVGATQTQVQHLLRPNAEAGVDVFTHSWNPDVGSFVDRQYGHFLRASLHQPVNSSLEKPRSQALSIGRAALMMRAYERRKGREYAMALVIRNDLVVGAPVDLRAFKPPFVWFATLCWRGRNVRTRPCAPRVRDA